MVDSKQLQGLILSPAELALVSKYKQLLLRQGSCCWHKQMEHGYRRQDEWKNASEEKKRQIPHCLHET